jgi:acyl-CoA thioester hydrolase
MKTIPASPIAYQESFNFYHPITVRYADLDPQQHVNNAAVVTYIESARMGYYQAVGIWDGQSFERFGMVVANLHIDYLAPIRFGQAVRVGLGVHHMGNKSMRFRFRVEDSTSGQALARGEVVMVAYDPQSERSIPIPTDWREKIESFEKRGTEK